MKTTINKVIQYYDYVLNDDDVVLYLGNNVCNEAGHGNLEGRVYFKDESVDYFSIAIGLATTTTKRIVVMFEDYYLLRYFNTLLQASVSKLNNLFLVLLTTNSYINSINQPTIFNYLKSSKGILFEAGFLIHTYTKFFKNKTMLEGLKNTYNRISGPAIGVIDVENNTLSGNTNDDDFNVKKFVKFIRHVEESKDTPYSATVLILKGDKEPK